MFSQPTPITPFLPVAVRGLKDKKKDVTDYLLALVVKGHFLVNQSDETFFFDNDTKTVMPIVTDNGEFVSCMGRIGATPNKTFIEHAHSYALAKGRHVDIHRLSYVDTDNNIIYVHSQGAKVFKVTASSDPISINNGDEGVYFLAEKGSTPFSMVELLPTDDDLFYDLLVKPLQIAAGVLDEEQACFMLIAWFCSLFLPGLLPVSPLLILIGPASSGKTTFMRSISELLFGKPLSVVRTPGDNMMFDAVIRNRSFLCLDNVSEWSDSLDERLESIARKESIFVRKGQDYVEQRLDCSMAITTRQFPDDGLRCINRLLPIVLKRPMRSLSELSLISAVRQNRDVIMTQLLVRLQRFLISLTKPTCGYCGSFMSADFADMASRMARAFGFDAQANDALERLSSLHDAVLSPDQQTIELLELWVGVAGNDGREVKATELHGELSILAAQQGKSIAMGKFPFAHWLSKSIAHLRQLFSVEAKEKRSREKFYAFKRTVGAEKDKE